MGIIPGDPEGHYKCPYKKEAKGDLMQRWGQGEDTGRLNKMEEAISRTVGVTAEF